MTASFVAVDWGTSNFRAFLVDGRTGQCLDETRSDSGLRSLTSSEFPHYCRRQLAKWRAAAGGAARLPVYLSGMVGARGGWAEAPQLELPLTLQALADALIPAPGLENAWIVPGGKCVSAEHADVMRGEEIQAFGALSLAERQSGLCCLPGTHSKWISMREGMLEQFTTLLTGELFHAVRFHTLLGRPMPHQEHFDREGFMRGLSTARHPAGVLHALFEARSRYLHDGLAPEQVGSFLSGVLIGSEVATMHGLADEHSEVLLVGSPALSESYRYALEAWNLAVRMIGSDAASIAGMMLLHERRRQTNGLSTGQSTGQV